MDDHAEEGTVSRCRYEFRITGKLAEQARSAFPGMNVAEVPAETVISGDVNDDGGVQEVLTMIQSLGLQLISVLRVPGGPAVRRRD